MYLLQGLVFSTMDSGTYRVLYVPRGYLWYELGFGQIVLI